MAISPATGASARVWAALLPDHLDAVAVRDSMLASGVIARPIGTDVIAFCPPLVITDAELDHCLDALESATT